MPITSTLRVLPRASVYHVNHGSKTGVLKSHLVSTFLSLLPPSCGFLVKRHRNNIGLDWLEHHVYASATTGQAQLSVVLLIVTT